MYEDLTIDDDVVFLSETTTAGTSTTNKILDEDVTLLCGFGFPKDQVINALSLCGGKKDLAATYLFDGTLPNENAVNTIAADGRDNNGNSTNNVMMNQQQSVFNNQHNNNSVNNPLLFLLEDPDFYEACYHANRHDRITSSKAILEALLKLGAHNPEYMQIIVSSPLKVIDLVASIEF
eukprot:g4739.t1